MRFSIFIVLLFSGFIITSGSKRNHVVDPKESTFSLHISASRKLQVSDETPENLVNIQVSGLYKKRGRKVYRKPRTLNLVMLCNNFDQRYHICTRNLKNRKYSISCGDFKTKRTSFICSMCRSGIKYCGNKARIFGI
ncbi:unnamed protein product [Clavelina lepadiformis]|uniref:Secreted protein n=1 Tax=Clavelina lepadiformis TaxID=159417 RepID=A0ABP0GAC3_CLALP